MKKMRKAITLLLTGSAMAVVSTHASAVNVTSANETFTPTGTITNGSGTNAIGTSMDNVGGFDGSGRAIAAGHIMSVDTSQAAVYHDYTTVKSWADMSIDLGWMHAVDWVQLNVANSGTYRISDQILGIRNVAGTADNATYTYSLMVQDTTIHPAFTVWSMSGSTFTSTGSSNNPTTVQSPLAYGYTTGGNNNTMGFNQVAAPATGNNGQFLLAGGVNGIVGYSNSGYAGWYNGNGDYVGLGTAGASSGINGDGYLWTDLTLNLNPGSYLIAVGGSCVDLVNCGPYQIRTTIATGATSTVYGTGWHELSVSAVPIPAAVWLFGSALAGLGVIGRRKDPAGRPA
jgi:hypothetical protein